MKEFILIFRHENAVGKVSPEQMQIWMQQTMEWIEKIQAKGQFINGTGLLFDGAKVVHHDKTVTNGPFGEIKETLGGYIMVKAINSDEASEIAKGSPVLQGEGNTVEVRELVKH